MISRTAAVLCALLAGSWVVMTMIWLDNRALAGIATSHAGRECVKQGSFSELVDVCSQLSHINKKSEQMLYDAKARMESIDVIRKENRRIRDQGQGRAHEAGR